MRVSLLKKQFITRPPTVIVKRIAMTQSALLSFLTCFEASFEFIFLVLLDSSADASE